MKNRVTIKDVLKTNEDVSYALELYFDYKDKKIDKDTFREQINAKFGVNFTLEFWNRYLLLINTIKDINFGDNSAVEKKKIQIERTKNNRYLTEIARREMLNEMIKEELSKREYNKIKKFGHYEKFEKETNVYIADLHYEEKGEFEKVFNSIPNDITHINLFFVGDETAGTIRVTDLLAGSDVVEQTCNLANEIINTIDNRVRKIVILPGNHSEVRMSNEVKGKENPNLTYVLYSILKNSLPVECIYADIYEDEDKIVQHGHAHRSSKALELFYEREDKLIVYGHWHTFSFNGDSLQLPSCKIKQDDYSKSLGFKNKPQIVLESNKTIKLINID